jgi:hypothetical protein
MRGKRVGDFALQMPVTRDQEFLLSQLAFCHQTGPPTNRRAEDRAVSLEFSDHFPWFLIG